MLSRPGRSPRGAIVLLLAGAALAGCGGPAIEDVPSPTRTMALPTATTAQPTAAVGATLGSACESGKLRFSDLTPMDDQWGEGLAVARGRALDWQADAELVELSVACELFEPGFRWQATYFSREAQAYYSSDTGEIAPVEVDPSSVAVLPEAEIRLAALEQQLASNAFSDEDPAITLESLRLAMTTRESPIGPSGIPPGHAVAHLRITSHGQAIELYVDVTAGGLYQYGEE